MKNNGGERFRFGDRPGPGSYRCTKCAKWIINIDDDLEILPSCFACGPGVDVQYERIHDQPLHLQDVQNDPTAQHEP